MRGTKASPWKQLGLAVAIAVVVVLGGKIAEWSHQRYLNRVAQALLQQSLNDLDRAMIQMVSRRPTAQTRKAAVEDCDCGHHEEPNRPTAVATAGR